MGWVFAYLSTGYFTANQGLFSHRVSYFHTCLSLNGLVCVLTFFPEVFFSNMKVLAVRLQEMKAISAKQRIGTWLRRRFFLVFFVLGFREPLIVVLRCLGRVVLRQAQVFCFEWACLAMLKVSLNFDSHSPHLWVLCVLVDFCTCCDRSLLATAHQWPWYEQY